MLNYNIPYLQTRNSFFSPCGAETVRYYIPNINYLYANPLFNRIIRIITIILSFAVVSPLYVWLNSSPAPYILPVLDVGEAFPMVEFFLLMSLYIVPHGRDREAFFNELEPIDKKGTYKARGA